MGALTTSVIAIVGLVLGWITIEVACKPYPDYDPDDAVNTAAGNDNSTSSSIRTPLIHDQKSDVVAAAVPSTTKVV
ncbi:hypothetical protein MKX01_030893 [Papaver californicum]|nr:hypothetical protein MKX01_030893 [Papaver californicum]